MHGHVQHVALGLVLRVGHRPRHGLPRLQPGPARLRAHDPGAGARAASSTSPRPSSPTGGAYHQYQPLTKRGNNEIGSGFNDDPLWLILGVAAYLKETGDLAILDEPVPFDNEPGTETPLFEHLRRSLDYTLDTSGPHGLPLIGRADWNDCLNLNCFSETPGESFQTHREPRRRRRRVGVHRRPVRARRRTSSRRSPSCAATTPEASRCRSAAAAMAAAVDEHGWDGEWFLRAYDFFGSRSARPQNDEGQIFIEPQGICVDGRHRPRRRARRRALDSVARAPGDAARDRAPAAGLHDATTSSSARSAPTRRATRRTPASSATTTRGS